MTATDEKWKTLPGLAGAREWMYDEGLALPRIPLRLAHAFRKRGEGTYATFDPKVHPGRLMEYIYRRKGTPNGDYALLAHAAHPDFPFIQQLHYYLAWGSVHLLLQLDWGGPFEDAETLKARRRRIRKAFDGADDLLRVVGGRNPTVWVAGSDQLAPSWKTAWVYGVEDDAVKEAPDAASALLAAANRFR